MMADDTGAALPGPAPPRGSLPALEVRLPDLGGSPTGLDGGRCDQLGSGASRYVYGVDPLGSVVHLLDSSLNRAGTYVYWPYGEVQSHTGADSPLQYVGGWGYYTSTVNRVYVRARDYRPDLGRWVTEDPIGFAGGDWNLHGYCGEAPSAFSDPSGAQVAEIAIPCGAGATVGTLVWVPGLGWAIVGGIVGGICLYKLYEYFCDRARPLPVPSRRGCMPCIPPLGSLGCREDTGHTHHPVLAGTPHWNCGTMHQSPPPVCQCFWNLEKHARTTPPPGWVPLVKARGGGPA